MSDQKSLLLAWIEAEGERNSRPTLLSTSAKDSNFRSWIQVGLCVVVGIIMLALLACWMLEVWQHSIRMKVINNLRQLGIQQHANDVGPPLQEPQHANDVGPPLQEPPIHPTPAEVGWLYCLRAIAILFGTLVGAQILRAGCWLYNRWVGGENSPDKIPMPRIGKVTVMAFLLTLVLLIVGNDLLAMPISLLVLSWMNAVFLPTTFLRGVLLGISSFLVGGIVAVTLAGIACGLYLLRALIW